jgi:hypothetical protein
MQTLGQVSHVGRYEVDYDWGTDDFMVIPNDNKGLLVVRAERKINGRDFVAWFSHLDEDFNLEWSDSIRVSKKLFIKGYGYSGAKNFLLLQDKNENRDLKIIRIDPYNDEIVEFEPRRLTEIEITDFEIINNSAVIAGYVDNRPAAFVYDMDSEKLRTLNNVYQNKSELLEIKVNEDNVTFNVIASVIDEKKDQTIQINTYDYQGNPVRDYRVETERDYQLITATSSSIYNVEQVITGLYSVKVGTSPSGFYVNHVDRRGTQSMRYIPFGQFNSFFQHEGEKREEKLKDRSILAARNNKIFRYKTEGIFRKMVEKDGELIVFVEFYKPWATTNYDLNTLRNRTNPLFSGGSAVFSPNTWSNNPDSFESRDPREFEFTHAFTFALDRSGNLRWDHNYEIDETKEGLLSSYGEFIYHDNNAYFAHYYDKQLVVEHLNKKDDEQEADVSLLSLLRESDELKYENDMFGGIIDWFDNRYLVYGIQHVRAKDEGASLRKVFFVNGIAIEPNFVPKQTED